MLPGGDDLTTVVRQQSSILNTIDCSRNYWQNLLHFSRDHEVNPLMKMYHDIPWYTMVYHGVPWYIMVHHGRPWCAMLCHILCMIMAYLFRNTTVYHSLPWFTTVYHCILPWFNCFKTAWYILVFYHGMPWHNVIRVYLPTFVPRLLLVASTPPVSPCAGSLADGRSYVSLIWSFCRNLG